MKTLTLHSDNEDNLRLIREVAEKIGVQVEEESGETQNKESVADVLREWHQNGGLQTTIEDPVGWQRAQRKDRKLPFRD
ncbi:hypothetical protein [Tunicatimonas pelagia]|uniref:hypothetical protein n=1 Tax=Tunicatimonas pelagia TaxID=931531 RepID=UPI002666DAF6|nr:hypothetical protein [Tunicatimonas pelagia]WKN44267.1 hypothetical protein P0M28_04725 [Tunicatimonas pelagia]